VEDVDDFLGDGVGLPERFAGLVGDLVVVHGVLALDGRAVGQIGGGFGAEGDFDVLIAKDSQCADGGNRIGPDRLLEFLAEVQVHLDPGEAGRLAGRSRCRGRSRH